MATAKLEKVERDFLICAICLEHYINPITLDCQHSFCRKCIGDYIKTRTEAREKKLIPCPCCSQMSRVPDPTRPAEEWAGQLKPGFVIQGLIDTLKTDDMQKEESPTTSCSMCQQLGETTPGILWCPECEETLCDRCVKMHRIPAATRDHNLVKPDEKGTTKKRRKVLCKEHHDEQIKFYCQDCDRALCHSCSVVYHRKCESVVTIQSMMPKIKADIAGHRRKLLKKEDLEGKLVKAKKQFITQLQKDKASILKEIGNARHRAMEQIKQKEKELIDQLNSVTEKYFIQLQADMKKGEIEKQTYRQCGEYIDQAVTSVCEMDIYDLFQTWKSGCLDIAQGSGTKTEERLIGSIRFDKDKQNIEHVLGDLNLGEIATTSRLCDPRSTSVLYNTTDSRSKVDKTKPDLHDVTVLVVDGVRTTLVTDRSNKCVKSFYTKHGQVCHGRLPLDGQPYCITKFIDNRVMVTVSNETIVTIKVTPDLVLDSTIKTSDLYESLAVLDPTTLLAGAFDRFNILNMEGQVMKSLSTHNNVKLFLYPWHTSVTDMGNIIVSDYGKKTVTCLTPEGDVVWITSDNKLVWPRGIATTSEGDILVADRDAQKVIQLSESGQYVRDMLTVQDGLSSPMGICVDNHGSLFVCDDGKIKEFIVNQES